MFPVDYEELAIPACLPGFCDQFDNAALGIRNKLLRAAYWCDLGYASWDTSKSLSFIASINAVESLFPKPEGNHRCSTCGKSHRGRGPSEMFRDYVERYAATEGGEKRTAIYTARSKLVHGTELHPFDKPNRWLSESKDWEYLGLHDDALAVAKTAIRNWFLEQ